MCIYLAESQLSREASPGPGTTMGWKHNQIMHIIIMGMLESPERDTGTITAEWMFIIEVSASADPENKYYNSTQLDRYSYYHFSH